jgi:hypothetical protein
MTFYITICIFIESIDIPAGTTDPVSGEFEQGSNQTFYFYPPTGMEVLEVYLDDTPQGASSNITLTDIQAAHYIYIQLQEVTGAWHILVNGYGAGATEGSYIPVTPGDNITLNFIPADGHVGIEELSVDGTPETPSSSYTFTNVTSDHAVIVGGGYPASMSNWYPRHPDGKYSRQAFGCAIDADGSNLFVCYDYRLYVSTDYGITWSEVFPVENPQDYHWLVTSNSDGSVLLAIANYGRAWLSTNSGSTWIEVRPFGNNNMYYTDCCSDDDGSVLVAASQGSNTLYVSTNGGTVWYWRAIFSGANSWNLIHCACDSDGSVIIATSEGYETKLSINSGVNFSTMTINGSSTNAGIVCACNGDGSVLIASKSNRLWRSTDLGANWSEIRPAGDVSLSWNDVAMDADGSTIIALARMTRAYISTDSGANWSEIPWETAVDKEWFFCGCSSIDGTRRIITSTDDSFLTYGGEPPGEPSALHPPKWIGKFIVKR